MDAVFERQSIRSFENREVEREKIEAILCAGMSAPSGGDQRPWEFYVIRDKDTIDRLSKSSPYSGCASGADVVIVTCFRTNGILYPELVYMDMSACVENMLIEITASGLGGVWLSIAPYEDRMQRVDDILGIGSELRSFAIIPIGYPAMKSPARDRSEKTRIHEVY